MDRNVNIITDLDGKKIVLINDIRFKVKRREYSENTNKKHEKSAKYTNIF